MKSNVAICDDTEEILNKLDNIYGASKCKDVLRNYISFLQLNKREKNKYGNSNILIRNQSEYGSVDEVVEIISEILKMPYRYLRREDLEKHRAKGNNKKIEKFEEDLLIIDTKKMDIYIFGWQNDIKELINRFPNKIFILIDKDEREGYINAKFADEITWTLEIERISEENKKHYITTFLNKSKIQFNSEESFIEVLAEEPFWKVKDELLNIVFECKLKNIKQLNDKVMKEELKREYYREDKGVRKGGSGLEELEDLIGMEEVKKQIHQILNFIKVNKQRGKMPSLHMCFLGNPGTGKTTVARIIGKIFSEMKILSDKERFVEAQRSDLIGEYVGHTAPLTKRTIRRADGGVLFIDEAYSLTTYMKGGSGKDFGSECIATLIKEMEDKRDTLCVILAGYSNEMEDMLSVNPGFESRIQFKINFPDYSEDELYEIFKQSAKKEGYKIASNLKMILLEYFRKEKQKENFSNARCVRNLFEKVKFEQAERVASNEDEDINLIKKCDIENVIIKIMPPEKIKRKIGFVA